MWKHSGSIFECTLLGLGSEIQPPNSIHKNNGRTKCLASAADPHNVDWMFVAPQGEPRANLRRASAEIQTYVDSWKAGVSLRWMGGEFVA
jgi:hypothetical protein